MSQENVCPHCREFSKATKDQRIKELEAAAIVAASTIEVLQKDYIELEKESFKDYNGLEAENGGLYRRIKELTAELRNIAYAKRFTRHEPRPFEDDTAFADWAQSRARHAIDPTAALLTDSPDSLFSALDATTLQTNERDELAEALRKIAEVCNGYGDEAGWACKHAREALAKVAARTLVTSEAAVK